MSDNQSVLMGALVMFTLIAIAAYPAMDVQADPFGKGSGRLSVIIGSGEALNDDYTILGVGAGYYVIDGLEIGLDGEVWLGGDPDIYKVSPGVRYVLPLEKTLRPYVGGFYRHTFIENFDDLDSFGARGGLYFIPGRNWYLGIGVVYENYTDCSERVYDSCDEVYPEITFALTF
jgi:hypothetical protein